MKAMSSLKSRVFLACAFVAVLSIAMGTLFVTIRVSGEAEAELRRDLLEASDLLEEHYRQRFQTLDLLARLVADLPRLKAAVATGDGPTVEPLAREYRSQLGSDVLVIVDDEGSVLSSIGGKSILPSAADLARAKDGRSSGSVIETDEGALQIATFPIVVGPEPPEVLGALSIGFFLDQQLARELASITQSDIILVARGGAVASTLHTSPGEMESLLPGAESSAEIGGEDYVVSKRILSGPEGEEGFQAVILRSRDARLSFLRTFQEGLMLSALFGILLAVVLSYAVARTVTRPLADITDTMREITTTGDLARKIELPGSPVDGDATLLAEAFNRLTDSIARFQREAASREKLSALGRMSTVIAHEIRNPLMIIKASLRTFRRRTLSSDEVREAADDIDHEVDRLNRIVGDVLDFARPIEIELRPTDLNAVCRSAAEAVQVDEGSPRIELLLDGSLPEILTDGERLRTALLNILTNAREAVRSRTSEERKPIVLETRRGEEGRFEIVVRDRGVGIPPEDLPKIFEPYFTAKRSGTGLGLAIVKNIVESLGGTVTAWSRPSEGSEIRVVLFLSGPSGPSGKTERPRRALPGSVEVVSRG